MGVATVNIGDRQKGRLMASSVVSCEAARESIAAAIDNVLSSSFQSSLVSVDNPYGDGGASEKIVHVIRKHPLDDLLKKSFFDLEVLSSRHLGRTEWEEP